MNSNRKTVTEFKKDIRIIEKNLNIIYHLTLISYILNLNIIYHFNFYLLTFTCLLLLAYFYLLIFTCLLLFRVGIKKPTQTNPKKTPKNTKKCFIWGFFRVFAIKIKLFSPLNYKKYVFVGLN